MAPDFRGMFVRRYILYKPPTTRYDIVVQMLVSSIMSREALYQDIGT